LIVENYYNSETVEQKAMFTLYKVTVKLMFTLYNNMMKFPKKIVKLSRRVNMSFTQHFIKCVHDRAVAGSKNPGGLVVLGGDNVPPLVEIGLTDLTKTGGAKAPLAPPWRRPCMSFTQHFAAISQVFSHFMRIFSFQQCE
jgi:hypothetical protein